MRIPLGIYFGRAGGSETCVSRPRILVVDDDPKFLHFVTELLTGAGYDVRGTDDPLAAPALVDQFRPRLAILDISMPGKDGLELAQELRKGGRTDLSVMFLTALRSADGMDDAKNTGAVAYLEKPVQSSKLVWMIRTLLENGES